MALKGEAKADWQREYMRDYMRRTARGRRPPAPRTPMHRLKAKRADKTAPATLELARTGPRSSATVCAWLFAHAANPDGLTDFDIGELGQ